MGDIIVGAGKVKSTKKTRFLRYPSRARGVLYLERVLRHF